MFGARARSRHGETEVVLPVHAARPSRLGRHAESGPHRYRVPGTNTQSSGMAESQRLLLSRRSDQWKVSVGESVRETNLERRVRLREERPPECGARHGADA